MMNKRQTSAFRVVDACLSGISLATLPLGKKLDNCDNERVSHVTFMVKNVRRYYWPPGIFTLSNHQIWTPLPQGFKVVFFSTSRCFRIKYNPIGSGTLFILLLKK